MGKRKSALADLGVEARKSREEGITCQCPAGLGSDGYLAGLSGRVPRTHVLWCHASAACNAVGLT